MLAAEEMDGGVVWQLPGEIRDAELKEQSDPPGAAVLEQAGRRSRLLGQSLWGSSWQGGWGGGSCVCTSPRAPHSAASIGFVEDHSLSSFLPPKCPGAAVLGWQPLLLLLLASLGDVSAALGDTVGVSPPLGPLCSAWGWI